MKKKKNHYPDCEINNGGECDCDGNYDPKNQKSWEATPARRKYWDSLKGLKNEKAPNWRGDDVHRVTVHDWLKTNYGKPSVCENPYCEKRSKIYEWCLRKGFKHERKRRNYIRLCRSCHRKYDWNKEKTQQAIKNLVWFEGGESLTKKAVLRINGGERKYESITEAAKDVGCSISSISNCLAGRGKTSFGYEWRQA